MPLASYSFEVLLGNFKFNNMSHIIYFKLYIILSYISVRHSTDKTNTNQ